jgi:anti-anti-sigma factor
MGIHIKVARTGMTATAYLAGRFDFSGRKRFQRVREEFVAASGVRSIRIDMTSVTHVDSAALGMLALLLDAAQSTGKQVALVNPGPATRAIIGVTRLAAHLDA